MTRKPLLSVIALVTLLSLALTGCGKMENEMDKVENEMDQTEELTADQRTELYQTAIENARDE